jgi:hypothetical protein
MRVGVIPRKREKALPSGLQVAPASVSVEAWELLGRTTGAVYWAWYPEAHWGREFFDSTLEGQAAEDRGSVRTMWDKMWPLALPCTSAVKGEGLVWLLLILSAQSPSPQACVPRKARLRWGWAPAMFLPRRDSGQLLPRFESCLCYFLIR